MKPKARCQSSLPSECLLLQFLDGSFCFLLPLRYFT